MGSNGGGLDFVFRLLAKRNSGIRDGQLQLAFNIIMYICCLFIRDVGVTLYSIMNAAICSFVMDKTHYQGVDVEIHIISKSFSEDMKQALLRDIGRGMTVIDAKGGWTGENIQVLYMLVDKNELSRVKKTVHRYDHDAFVIADEGAKIISGHYLRKL